MKIILIALMFLSTTVHAQNSSIAPEQAIKAIIGEAEDQGPQGMLAVACGIRNRGTLKGVYGVNAPRVKNHKYSAAILKQATQAWEFSEEFDNCIFLDGADHWENIKAFGKPSWANRMTETYKYKDHVFYRKETL